MNNIMKCAKCGKEKELNFKNLAKVVECDHCHCKMVIDYNSYRMFRYLSMAIILLLAVFLLYGFTSADNKIDLIPKIIILSLALAFTFYSEKTILFIIMKFFKLKYIRYIPQKKGK